METKVINLFGNPGSGKSTVAAFLFSELKAYGVEVELVTETAKDLVWDEDWKRLSNQMYVFSTQLHRVDRLVGKVRCIITDSPLLLQIGYYKERRLPLPKQFKKLCIAYNKRYNNINIWLKNNKDLSPIGRAEKDLNPMKYITNFEYDLKTNCKDKFDILRFVLEKLNINPEDIYKEGLK